LFETRFVGKRSNDKSEIVKELSEQEALYKAEAYCSLAEHCLSEVAEKLEQWGVSSESKTRILKKLVAERFIDESRYCRFFIHDKFKYNKWGRNKIAQALWQKKIDRQVSDPLLGSIDEEEYRNVLCGLLEAKRKTVKARNEYELNGKLIRFALGRGFEMNEIKACLSLRDDDGFMDE